VEELLYDRRPDGDLLYQWDVVQLVGRASELLDEQETAASVSIEVSYDLRCYALGEFSPTPPRSPDGAALDPSSLAPGMDFRAHVLPLRPGQLDALRRHLEDLRALRVPVRTIVARTSVDP
jgi:hypothetical protein